MRRILHLHLGALAVGIAATFTFALRTWQPNFCPPAFKRSCTVAMSQGDRDEAVLARGSSTPGPTPQFIVRGGAGTVPGSVLPQCWPSAALILSHPLAREAPRYRHTSGWGSGLEAFSHNPSEGRFAPLAGRPSTRPQYLITQFLSY